MAEAVDAANRMVRAFDYFDQVIVAAKAREEEVAGWPEPSIEDLDTLFSENVPHHAERPTSPLNLGSY
jgi:hypothetical protein